MKPLIIIGFVLISEAKLLFAADSCSQFSVTSNAAEASELDEITETLTSISVDVSETVPVDSTLYTVTWIDDLTLPPYIKEENNDAMDYVTYVVEETAKTMTVNVNNSMETLVDYDNPDRKDLLEMTLYFEFTTLEIACQLYIYHNVLDENTATPISVNDTYKVDIREDFPINLEVPGIEAIACDYDATSPNNEFNVTTDDECPLIPVEDSYVCTEGATVTVAFQLATALDYDTMEEPYTYLCVATFKDYGSPSLSSQTTIEINVIAYNDEEPTFTSDFYYGLLPATTVGSSVSTTPQIEAYDQDVPASTVMYSMEAANPAVGGDEYFSIDTNTGEVTVTQDIDQEFLANGQVQFLLTATDTDSAEGKAFLAIDLSNLQSTQPPATTFQYSSSKEPSTSYPTTEFQSSEINSETPPPTTQPPSTTFQFTSSNEPSTSNPTTETASSELNSETPPPIPTSLKPPTTETGSPSSCPACTCEPSYPTTTSIITTELPQQTSESNFPTCPQVTCDPCPTKPPATLTMETSPPCTCPPTEPQVTCPSSAPSGPPITVSPPTPKLKFDYNVYAFQSLTYFQTVGEVHAEGGNGGDIKYSWANDGSIGLSYFEIGEYTGVITAIQTETSPDTYVLVAIATDGNQTDQATVNIIILLPIEGIIVVEESVKVVGIAENTVDAPLAIVEAVGAKYFCLLAVKPDDFSPFFSLNNTSGELSVVLPLDADDPAFGNKVTLKLAAYENYTVCLPSPIGNQLMSNEELIEVIISDVNEFPPVFLDGTETQSSQILYGYPKDKAIQRTVGTVAQLKTEDLDLTQNIQFSTDSNKFAVDDVTGELFAVGNFDCPSKCEFSVFANDLSFRTELLVQVTELDNSNIFTMVLGNVQPNVIEDKLMDISKQINASVNLLYTTVQSMIENTRNDQTLDQNGWVLNTHVYVVTGMQLLNLNDFNELLQSQGIPTAKSFSEGDIYGQDYKTATIVLGSLLGVALVCIAVYVGHAILTSHKKRKLSTRPLNTLGEAYGNRSYEDTEPSFQTIFGNLPLDDPKRNSKTLTLPNTIETVHRASVQNHQEPTNLPRNHSPPYVHLTTDERQTTQKPGSVSSKTSSRSHKGSLEIDKNSLTSLPSLKTTKDYEKEIIAAAADISESMDRFSLEGDRTPFSLLSETSTSTSVPIAPPREALDQDDRSSMDSDKKSSLKQYPDLSCLEEPKFVVFKVLVDTKEFETNQEDEHQHPIESSRF